MKRVLGIFLKPVATIREICDEEPIFSSLLVFSISILIANYRLIYELFSTGYLVLFNSLAFLSVIAMAMLVGTLLLTAILSIGSPSQFLIAERFRKLVISSCYLSSLMLLRPVLSLLFSNRMTWIILSIWMFVLLLIVLVYLWDITETRAFVGLIFSMLLMLWIIRVVLNTGSILRTEELDPLINSMEKQLSIESPSLLGTFKSEYDDKQFVKILSIIDSYKNAYPKSLALPYSMLVKAKIFSLLGKNNEAIEELLKIVETSDTPSEVYDTAMLALYEMMPAEDIILLTKVSSRTAFKPVLELWRLPSDNYKGEVARLVYVKGLIEKGTFKKLNGLSARLIELYKDSAYEDDVLFWLAKRYEKEGAYKKAMTFYVSCISVSDSLSNSSTLNIESKLAIIEDYIGIDILDIRVQGPYAMLCLGRLLEQLNQEKAAVGILFESTKKYPGHALTAHSLYKLANITEKLGNFDRAVRYYQILIKDYTYSYLSKHALFRKKIIKENLASRPILSAYTSGLKEWQKENYIQAIKIYKNIIKSYPDTDIAKELQYNIAEYYRLNSDFMKAIDEYRKGYDMFKGTARGFDLGWKLGQVLYEELKYYRNAISVFEEIRRDYGKDYKSYISGVSTLDLAWLSAEISKEKIKNYKKAKVMYSEIAELYNAPDTVARAWYETALIEEEIFHKYSRALSIYTTIIANYPSTIWKVESQKRKEKIYQSGLKLLESSY